MWRRGKGAGGTESVNIVSFNDIWDRYVSWLNPQFLIESELDADEGEQTELEMREMQEEQAGQADEGDGAVPWELIRAYMDAIRTEYADPNRPAPICAVPIAPSAILALPTAAS